ncbi:hypothetical protein [Chryseobacterium scophthalmum]|nr:hypothetical protein [Chryseobacterium scophthalmum]
MVVEDIGFNDFSSLKAFENTVVIDHEEVIDFRNNPIKEIPQTLS